jgi:hypothetical protein
MMMMMELEKATRGLDVYVVASNNTGGTPTPAGGSRGRGAAGVGQAGVDEERVLIPLVRGAVEPRVHLLNAKDVRRIKEAVDDDI